MLYSDTMTQSPDLAALEPFLIALNRASGETVLPLFRVDNGLEDKGGVVRIQLEPGLGLALPPALFCGRPEECLRNARGK